MKRILFQQAVASLCRKVFRSSLIIFLIAGNGLISFCQNDYRTPVTPPAPTSAVFSRYGNDQPSLQTGTINIPISLFNVQAYGLNIPLNLTYQTSGINVFDNPYPAGYGWVFSGGFRISRTILGRLDDAFQFRESNASEDYETIKPGIIDEQIANQHGLNQGDLFDTQKDIFALQMPSGSFNFFIKKNGSSYEAISIGHQIKIVPQNPGGGGLTGFVVTDDDGIVYKFGYDDPNTFQDFTEPTELGYGASSWMLREIVLLNGDKVYFTWQKVNTNAYAPKVNTPIVIRDRKDFTCDYIPPYEVDDPGGIIDYGTNAGANALMLKKIDYPDGVVDLTYKSTSDPFLQSIVAKNKGNDVIKAINFTYGMSTSNASNLLLYSLSINNEKYNFQYNSNYFGPLTTALDYWGFYNGKTSNQSLIPAMTLKIFTGPATLNGWGTINYNVGYADRSVSAEHMKAFMLTKVQFPTGGYSEYEYEPHQFPGQSAHTNGNLFLADPVPISSGGGLRVSKITTYASVGDIPTIKTFKYGQNEDGLANPPIVPTLETFIDEMGVAYEEPTPHPNCTMGGLSWRSYRQMSIKGFSNYSKYIISKSPIWYSEVTEYVNNEQKTESYFSFDDTYAVSWQNSLFAVQTPYVFRYDNLFNSGPKLDSSRIYKKTGTVYTRLQRTINEYERIQSNDRSISNVLIDRKGLFLHLTLTGVDLYPSTGYYYPSNSVPGPGQFDFYKFPYYITVQYDRLKQTSTILHNDDQTLTTYDKYLYNDYEQVKQVTKASSIAGKENVIKYKYPRDFSDPVYLAMATKNMVSPVIEEKNYKLVSGVETLLNTTQTAYKQVGSLIVKDAIKTSIGSLTPETRFTYNQYDAKANLLEQQKVNDVKNSYLWGYNGSYPIAEAINASYNEIFFDGFEEANTWNSITALDNTRSHTGRYSARIDNPGPGEYFCHSVKWLTISLTAPTKYKYSGWVYSNGPSVEILLFMKRNGETGYYTYVDAVATSITGKWVYIEKEYTVPSDVTQLNIRIDNNSPGTVWYDDIRLHPSVARMTTYTYAPLIGMTSVSDLNNRVSYYEYDQLNRLKLIRDNDRNVIKKFCYNYAGQPEDCGFDLGPNWQNTATAIRCKVVSGNYTGEREQEQKDMNSHSPTYNQLQWVVIDQNCTVCPKPGNWQSTGNYRCAKDGNNDNTGIQEKEEKDMESCSATYNQLRWVFYAVNTTACPVPCNISNCNGPNKKCIGGVCETGTRINRSSVKINISGTFYWRCTYYYCFTDGSISADFTEDNVSPCTVGSPCLF
jgi:hypothetical protein